MRNVFRLVLLSFLNDDTNTGQKTPDPGSCTQWIVYFFFGQRRPLNGAIPITPIGSANVRVCFLKVQVTNILKATRV